MLKSTKLFLTSMTFMIVVLFTLLCPVKVNAAKLKKSNDQYKKDFTKYSVSVLVDDQYQRFAIKKNEIKSLKINKIKYNKSKTIAYVKATVGIDRGIATVKGKATITYMYDNKTKKWKLSDLNYTKTCISKFNLIGTWTGTYKAGQGITKAEVVVPGMTNDGFIQNAVFYFSAVPTNPTVPSGSYKMIGGLDMDKGIINFTGDEWIEQPDGYDMIDFDMYINLEDKCLSGNNQCTLTKK